jgi:hypothetical protein
MIDREEARQRGRDYINSKVGEAAAEALGALLEALERAGEANSDDAREDAHKQTMAARADLEAAIGVRGWRRQRIVSTAAGQPAHRPVATAKGVESIFRRGGRDTEQRFAMSRILMDELGGILGGRPENLEAATLILAEKGYYGPQAKPGKDSGLRAPAIRQGVNPHAGASETGRWGFYTALGYTLGAEGKRDCRPSEWKQRAALHLRAIGPKPRPGPKPRRKQPTIYVGLVEAERVVAAAWAHIEDDSKDRDPNDESEFQSRELFRAGWRQGEAARRANCIENSLKLRTK